MRQEIINILEMYEVKFSKKSNTKRLVSLLKNSDKIYWNWVSIHLKLSEQFIREFKDKVYWVCISGYQKLSEEFIREFQNKVNWDSIKVNQKLSEDFIREFKDKFVVMF